MSDKIKVTLPKEFTKRIANRAVKHAQNDMARRGWSPNTVRNGIRPYFDDGKYGIATNEGYEYIKFQDRGFKAFLMTSLEGKKVPIGDRVVTAKDVGKPGFVRIPRENGRGYKNVWRNQKWRHPGLEPKNFLNPALSRARLEEGGYIRREIMKRMKGL